MLEKDGEDRLGRLCEVLQIAKEEKDTLRIIKQGKMVGRIEVMGRQGKRPKHLLDDLKEMRS